MSRGMSRARSRVVHAVLITTAVLTLLPFLFMVNNVFRDNTEFYHSFFAFPDSFKGVVTVLGQYAGGDETRVIVKDSDGSKREVNRSAALGHYVDRIGTGPQRAWDVLRQYMINTFIVSGLSALGVCLLGSATAYILARYRFFGSRSVFLLFLATMMFPGVLTLVPSFLLVKELGLLNTYWSMILPYVAAGQVFAIFVFRSFFAGLSEELFESARIDGAGHWGLYWHIVLPLSRPVFSVVIIMNILGTWNNFLWPFIVNTDGAHHVISSGLFTLANSAHASNLSTMFAAYAISSIPLLLLFVYATKTFIRGMTAGSLKA